MSGGKAQIVHADTGEVGRGWVLMGQVSQGKEFRFYSKCDVQPLETLEIFGLVLEAESLRLAFLLNY